MIENLRKLRYGCGKPRHSGRSRRGAIHTGIRTDEIQKRWPGVCEIRPHSFMFVDKPVCSTRHGVSSRNRVTVDRTSLPDIGPRNRTRALLGVIRGT